MVDTTGTTTYAYDPYGRLQSVVNGAGAHGHLRLRRGQQHDLSLLSQLGHRQLPERHLGHRDRRLRLRQRQPDDLAEGLELQDHQLRLRLRLQLERHHLPDHDGHLGVRHLRERRQPDQPDRHQHQSVAAAPSRPPGPPTPTSCSPPPRPTRGRPTPTATTPSTG